MLIRRFDRYWVTPNMAKKDVDLMESLPGNGAVEKRLAFVSGLTMVGCDESQSPTKAYSDIAEAINKYCHPLVIRQNKRELFSRMIYNILVSNDDDHLRNHGFVWDPTIAGWRLSPLYDVMPRPGISFERQLHLGVGVEGRLATFDNAITSCEKFSLSKTDAELIIGEVWSKVREWRVYFGEYGVSEEDMGKVSSAFRHVDEIASNNLKRNIP
jgi:serine/threonine-protein kinase HipA